MSSVLTITTHRPPGLILVNLPLFADFAENFEMSAFFDWVSPSPLYLAIWSPSRLF